MSHRHPSDLALEKLFAGDASARRSWWRHVARCDDCWARWCALHAEEGHPRPRRPVWSATRPWAGVLGGGLTIGAIAAAVALWVRAPVSVTTELDQLRSEAAALRDEVTALEQAVDRAEQAARVAEASDPVQAPLEYPPRMAYASERQGQDGPVDPARAPITSVEDIPPDLLDEAVEAEIALRAARKHEVTRKRSTDEAFERIGRTIDRMLADGVLSDLEAGDVEYLLQEEVEETWRLKQAVQEGRTSEGEAVTVWQELRDGTDTELVDLVGPDRARQLRADLEGTK